MKKGSHALVRLQSTPIGAASSWYLGKVESDKDGVVSLSETCKVFELHHQDQKSGQTSVIYNVVHDRIVTDGVTSVSLTGAAWKEIGEEHVLWKYYQNALTDYRAVEAGIVLPVGDTKADGGTVASNTTEN